MTHSSEPKATFVQSEYSRSRFAAFMWPLVITGLVGKALALFTPPLIYVAVLGCIEPNSIICDSPSTYLFTGVESLLMPWIGSLLVAACLPVEVPLWLSKTTYGVAISLTAMFSIGYIWAGVSNAATVFVVFGILLAACAGGLLAAFVYARRWAIARTVVVGGLSYRVWP